jgi:hypothetical protein
VPGKFNNGRVHSNSFVTAITNIVILTTVGSARASCWTTNVAPMLLRRETEFVLASIGRFLYKIRKTFSNSKHRANFPSRSDLDKHRHYVVKEGKPPENRFGLDRGEWQSRVYWAFRR